MAETVEIGTRRIVEFERTQMRHLAALNMRVDDAPAGGVDHFAFVDRGRTEVVRAGEPRFGFGHRIGLAEGRAPAAGGIVLLQKLFVRVNAGGMCGNGGGEARGCAKEPAARDVCHV